MSRPGLAELRIADPAARWEALGFSVRGEQVELGGVQIVLGGPGRGITHWAIHGLHGEVADIDGLPTGAAARPPLPRPDTHPNQASGLDHVVVSTPDFDRTAHALEGAGLPLRRIRDAGTFRQGFRRIGPAILELVEARAMPDGPARFWGLVVIVSDLEALRARLHPHLSEPKPAVQPGRLIATLGESAGLSPRVAFMTPERS